MNPHFWRNKRVFVTGHTGFKGSWLSLWLQDLGAAVIGYSLQPPTTPNLFTLANVAQGMVTTTGDVCNYGELQKTISYHKPDIIIHMAAQSLVRYSYDNPLETYATNVMGTVNLLEAARQTSAKVVINVTSDKCYENKANSNWVWGYRENDVLGGFDPYSNSKACAELVTSSFRNSYFSNDSKSVAIASVRAGNVIGGGDWAQDRLIPDLIKSILEERQLLIRYPNAIRPWQHVLEPLHGYLQLAEQAYQHPKGWAEAWNFGPSDADFKPVAWIADKIFQIWNRPANWKVDGNSQPQETFQLKLDSSKARSMLGWQPRWDLEQALNETVTWYRAYANKEDMHSVSLDQIRKYMRMGDSI